MMQLLVAAQMMSSAFSFESIDWSLFSDSVLIEVERPAGHKMGNTICSGVILNPHLVLTTAHCAEGATSMTVVFDVEKGAQAVKKEKVLPAQMKVHPGYEPKKSLYKNDLVLLFLKNPAPLELKMIRKIPEKNSLVSGDRLIRIGVGMRNGKNLRNVTNPIYVGKPAQGVLETSDIFSYFGDSGGPLYNFKYELIAIHSTLDDFDGKKTPHAFSVYLPDYQEWIQRMSDGKH